LDGYERGLIARARRQLAAFLLSRRHGIGDQRPRDRTKPLAISARDMTRMLLAEIAGKDLYAAELPLLREMVNLLVDLQRRGGDRVEELLAVGLRAQPWTGVLDDQPRRHPFARPGGPSADLAWACALLADRGLPPTERPAQVRTWNLSSLWRVPVEGQTVWLKVVPHFFAHEGGLLALMAGTRVPTVLGHEGTRLARARAPLGDHRRRRPDGGRNFRGGSRNARGLRARPSRQVRRIGRLRPAGLVGPRRLPSWQFSRRWAGSDIAGLG
jgi:hypothetical protein